MTAPKNGITGEQAERLKRVLRQVRRIELDGKKHSLGKTAGAYSSIFRGEGIEFESVREYDESDDPRRIDANVSARMGRPFVKIFTEEREQNLIFMVDVSGSSEFGQGKNKRETAAEVCANLGYNAVLKNDKMALCLFSDKIEKIIPPAKGQKQLLKILREILFFRPLSRQTSISNSLEFFKNKRVQHGLIFLISDFMDKEYSEGIKLLSSRYHFYLMWMRDVKPKLGKGFGLVRFMDSETGKNFVLNTSDRDWLSKVESNRDTGPAGLVSGKVRLAHIRSDVPVYESIRNFFIAERRRR